VPTGIALGFVSLLCLMGLIDLRHARAATAKLLGALALVGAGGCAGYAAWQTLDAPGTKAATWLAVAGGVSVVLGLVGDALGDLRSRSFTASLTVTAFALLLPSSIGDTPRAGAVLFVGAICIAASSLTGAIVRRVLSALLYRDEDEDEEDEAL
jgi:hypothetical protein